MWQNDDASRIFSSRRLFTQGDEGVFDDYVTTAIDPGVTIFFATTLVLLCTILFLPCLVICGIRYEKGRLRRLERNMEKLAEGELYELPLEDPVISIGKYDTVSATTSNANSFIHGRGGEKMHAAGLEGFLTKTMDKIACPPYPDDDSKSILSSAWRSNVSGISSRSNTSSNVDFSKTTVLDASVLKRRKKLRKCNAIDKSRRVKKMVVEENMFCAYGNPNLLKNTRNDTKSELGAEISQMIKREDESGSVNYQGSDNGMEMSRFRGRNRKKNSTRPSDHNERLQSSDLSFASHSLMSDNIFPNDAADANDPGFSNMEEEYTICCGRNAIWRPSVIAKGLDYLFELSEYDNETKRILKLSIPFTVSAIVGEIFEIIGLAFVGHFLGTNSLAAYAIVEILLGTTGEAIDGIVDASTTVCTHAVGTGNNYLAGQYIQMSSILYFLGSIPCIIFWLIYTHPAVMWLQLGDEIATIGSAYAYPALVSGLVEGLSECYHNILEVTDHEQYCMYFDIVEGIIELVIEYFVLSTWKISLAELAWLEFALGNVFLVISVVYTYKRGWMKSFWKGIFMNNSLKNTAGLMNVLTTAAPLSLGNLMSYAEWEVLTICAAYLGTAEVTTWAILGSVWECFEAATGGIGDGAEVRVAYHLGRGNPSMARTSAYKSLLIGVLLGIIITAILLIIGDDLPGLFTTDRTIQRMIIDVIPLIGLGNVTMTFGMLSWSIVGAQGRYRLATFVMLICSFFVTMPLAAGMTYGLYLDLKGLVSAVVIGYGITGMVMSYIIIRSDWGRLSHTIIEMNKITGKVCSIDSDSDGNEKNSISSKSSDDDDSSDDEDDSSDDKDSDKSCNTANKSSSHEPHQIQI